MTGHEKERRRDSISMAEIENCVYRALAKYKKTKS